MVHGRVAWGDLQPCKTSVAIKAILGARLSTRKPLRVGFWQRLPPDGSQNKVGGHGDWTAGDRLSGATGNCMSAMFSYVLDNFNTV
jgi:hypothetical protein